MFCPEEPTPCIREENKVLYTLTAGNGTTHVITEDGLITNGIFHAFIIPLSGTIQKAGTSITGKFVWILIDNFMYLLTVTKTSVSTERIGNPTTEFIGAEFNIQETVLITVTLSNHIVLFETFPPLHLISFEFEAPVPPVSLKYNQLKNRLFIAFSDGVELQFALPNSFEVATGSAAVPIEPLEQVETEDIAEDLESIQNWHRSVCGLEPAEEEEEEEPRAPAIRTGFSVMPSELFIPNIKKRLHKCLARQDNLASRFAFLMQDVHDFGVQLELGHLAQERCDRRFHSLVARLCDLIDRATHHPLLDELAEDFYKSRKRYESAKFCADYVRPDQADELREMEMEDHMSQIEQCIRCDRPPRVFKL